MIRSFKDVDTAALFSGGHSRRFQSFERVAIRKLHQLNQTKDLLKELGSIGDRKDQWSMRINDQWRLCFAWHEGDAFDVEIVDYH